MKTKNTFSDTLNSIKSIFFKGLFTLLPLAITFLILRASFKIIYGWVQPIHNIQPKILQDIQYSEFLTVLIFIFIIGLVLQFFFLEKIIHFLESILFRIPLMRTLYSGIKQLIHALTHQDQLSFQKVVLLEFPSQGIYSVGFLTGEFPLVIDEKGESYYNVFVPHTPNPTTGFFIILHKNKVKEIDLTKQEAITLIISGGIIQPKRFKK